MFFMWAFMSPLAVLAIIRGTHDRGHVIPPEESRLVFLLCMAACGLGMISTLVISTTFGSWKAKLMAAPSDGELDKEPS